MTKQLIVIDVKNLMMVITVTNVMKKYILKLRHEKKYPIEIDEDKQSLNDEESQVQNICKNVLKIKMI